MNREEIIGLIRRRFGAPVIKVELDDSHIIDALNEARDKFIKWAVGNATQEVWFTVMLSAGQYLYDMPTGVTEVVSYELNSLSSGGVNKLFTIENYLYNEGYYSSLFDTAGNYTFVSYQIAQDFLDTISKYHVDAYNYKYHKYTNQLEIQPPPASGNNLNILDSNGNTISVDSPGFILLRTYMIEGSTLPGYEPVNNADKLYNEDWIIDYTYALSMRTLGLIRRKHENNTAVGNTPITLDGSVMMSEALDQIKELEEQLKAEAYDGYGIYIGF